MDPITEILLPKLEGVRQLGGYWKALCPAHEDREASMTIGRGTSQPVVIRCHAGCDSADILANIGLAWTDLCEPREENPQRGEWTPHGDAVAVLGDLSTDEGAAAVAQAAGSTDPVPAAHMELVA